MSLNDSHGTGSRGLAAVAAVILGAYSLWHATLLAASRREYVLFGILAATAGTLATMCLWYALRGHVPHSRAIMRSGCMMGLIAGLIGLTAGFILPLVLSPNANEGPLLGILITGPIAGILGTGAGILVAKLRSPRIAPTEPRS